MKSATALHNPPEAGGKKKERKISWSLNVLPAKYTWGEKGTGKERRQSYWGNNSDFLAFDIDHTLKIDGRLKAAVIYGTICWLPGKLMRLDWIERISVNLRPCLILETSGPWRSLVTGRWGGRQRLRRESLRCQMKLRRLDPFLWPINPEQEWPGSWAELHTASQLPWWGLESLEGSQGNYLIPLGLGVVC